MNSRYFKFVNRAVEKADMMLKLLGTPVSYLAASFHDMWVRRGSASVACLRERRMI